MLAVIPIACMDRKVSFVTTEPALTTERSPIEDKSNIIVPMPNRIVLLFGSSYVWLKEGANLACPERKVNSLMSQMENRKQTSLAPHPKEADYVIVIVAHYIPFGRVPH